MPVLRPSLKGLFLLNHVCVEQAMKKGLSIIFLELNLPCFFSFNNIKVHQGLKKIEKCLGQRRELLIFAMLVG